MSTTWWKDPADLIPEQADLLDLPEDQSLLIKGPPGSGKTNLMLLRANQLFIGDRPNLHVVVFGSVLKQFIQIGGTQYKFPSEKIAFQKGEAIFDIKDPLPGVCCRHQNFGQLATSPTNKKSSSPHARNHLPPLQQSLQDRRGCLMSEA